MYGNGAMIITGDMAPVTRLIPTGQTRRIPAYSVGDRGATLSTVTIFAFFVRHSVPLIFLTPAPAIAVFGAFGGNKLTMTMGDCLLR